MWISQVTGLRGHVIDPFGGGRGRGGVRGRPRRGEAPASEMDFIKQPFVNSAESICQFYYISRPDGF